MEIRRYDPFSQALHWLIAVVILATYVIALVRDELPRGTLRTDMLSYNKAFGLLVFGLTLLRLGWRSVHSAPQPLSSSALMNAVAKVGHVAAAAIVHQFVLRDGTLTRMIPSSKG